MLVLNQTDIATITRLADLQLAQVQDPTSASVVEAADIKPGMSVLDRCSGMGTKTLQAQQLAGPNANIVAIDAGRRPL